MSRKTAARIVRIAYDPDYGSEKEQLAQELGDWHGGPVSGLFAVSNSWLQGGEATLEDIDRALSELQGLLDTNAPAEAERLHVQDLISRLRAVR